MCVMYKILTDLDVKGWQNMRRCLYDDLNLFMFRMFEVTCSLVKIRTMLQLTQKCCYSVIKKTCTSTNLIKQKSELYQLTDISYLMSKTTH